MQRRRADLQRWNVQAPPSVRRAESGMLRRRCVRNRSYLPIGKHVPRAPSVRRIRSNVLQWKRVQWRAYLPIRIVRVASGRAMRRGAPALLQRCLVQCGNGVTLPDSGRRRSEPLLHVEHDVRRSGASLLQ